MAAVRTVAVINQKGGVGKTTTVANVSAALAAAGTRVCLVDLDPQANLTMHFGVEPGTSESSIYEVLTEGTPLARTARPAGQNLRLVPSTIDLAAAELELAATVGRERILADSLTAEPLDADLVLIDCPPALGLLTLNALAAADEVLIPLQPHFLGLQGLGKLLETVSLVRQRLNPRLSIAGVVLCMYETNTRLTAEVVADLEDFFASSGPDNTPWRDARLFKSVIRRNVKLAECPSHGVTIFDYEPRCNGAEDYGALAAELAAYWRLRGDSAETPEGSAEPPAAPPSPSPQQQAPSEQPQPGSSPQPSPAEPQRIDPSSPRPPEDGPDDVDPSAPPRAPGESPGSPPPHGI
jgi:chromosome partitioning protein